MVHGPKTLKNFRIKNKVLSFLEQSNSILVLICPAFVSVSVSGTEIRHIRLHSLQPCQAQFLRKDSDYVQT